MIFYVKSRKDFLPQKSVFLFDATVPGYIFVYLSLILFTKCLRKQVGRGGRDGQKWFFCHGGWGGQIRISVFQRSDKTYLAFFERGIRRQTCVMDKYTLTDI